METFSLSGQGPENWQRCGEIVRDEFPTALAAVYQTILVYADGNMGAARLLARACAERDCATAADVTRLVGWPLPLPGEARQEEGWQLYLRFKSGYAQDAASEKTEGR